MRTLADYLVNSGYQLRKKVTHTTYPMNRSKNVWKKTCGSHLGIGNTSTPFGILVGLDQYPAYIKVAMKIFQCVENTVQYIT